MFALLALVLPAAAALPTWNWVPGQEYKFYLAARFQNQVAVKIYAKENTESKYTTLTLVLNTTCVPKAVGKNVELACSFSHVGLNAVGFSGEQERLDKISKEWSEMMRPASVELLLGPDGRVKEMDLDGIEKTSSRVGNIIDAQRTLLLRTFSIFHLPLPADPKDFIRGWKDPSPTTLVGLATASGTVGAVDLVHREDGDSLGLTEVLSEAKGTIAKGASVDSSSGYMLTVTAAGVSLIDPAKGILVYRNFQMDTETTASAGRSGNDAYFRQVTLVQAVDTFPADGNAPPNILAERQPRVAKAPADIPGVAVVPFEQLGVSPLFMQMPESVRALSLPKNTVKARVHVSSDGLVRSVEVFDGYEVLAETVEGALRASAFPSRGETYVVDVAVEMRPAE